MPIQFDASNLSAAMVGEANGVTSEELRAAEGVAKNALAGFRKLHETGNYGFPDLPNDSKLVNEILAYAARVRGSFDTVCLVGIGGSALGAWALDCGLRGPHPVQRAFSTGNPRLAILDNVDPSFVMGALDSMTPERTLVVVIAKSGATAETISTFLIVREWLVRALGQKATANIAVVTSETNSELKDFATEQKYETFHLPKNVGGRFSVLSAVGLLPAALIGVHVGQLLDGASAMTELCWSDDLSRNIGLQSALYHFLVWTRRNKPIQVAFPYSNRLWGTAFWFRQLWAESLGKAALRSGRKDAHVGQTPVAALGTTDQHSQVQLYIEGPNDKVFSFWAVKDFGVEGRVPQTSTGKDAFDYLSGQTLAKLIDAERRATAAAMTDNGRPNCTYTLDRVDEWHLGAFLQMMEFQTAFVGEMLDIDAFDQPGVELGKKYTFALMGRKGNQEYADRFAKYEAKQASTKSRR